MIEQIKNSLASNDAENAGQRNPTALFTEVGFEVFKAVSTKMAVFWVVAPYDDRPDDGSSKDL
jgi:hypothetical protein